MSPFSTHILKFICSGHATIYSTYCEYNVLIINTNELVFITTCTDGINTAEL